MIKYKGSEGTYPLRLLLSLKSLYPNESLQYHTLSNYSLYLYCCVGFVGGL